MLIFDAHIDTLSRLVKTGQGFHQAQGHVHLQTLRESKIGAQFFAAFVDPKLYQGMALHSSLEMIDQFWQLVEEYSEELRFAGSAEEIIEARKDGKIACLLAIEGGEALEGKLANLRMFYRLGVRLITLTWNHRNQLASGQSEGNYGGGLSKFGREVVQEMNHLGMLIDVSHLNELGFWEVLKLSTRPVLASHSNARALCDHPRNLTDEQIRALSAQGGVIGVNFFPYFLDPSGKATIGHVVEQIDYLIQVGGIDCVGLGSDFDGINSVPQDLENCAQIQNLVPALAQKGYGEREIEQVMGGNLLRLCTDVLG